MNTVFVNGKTYTAPDGCSVSVRNNKVYFNGKLAEDFNDWKEKNIEIKIVGNCKEVNVDTGNLIIEGNVEGDINADTGNIKIRGDVKGNVTTDTGNVSAHHIFGNASSDIGNINGISGSIVSGGNVINCNNNNKTYNYRTKKINWFREFFDDLFR